MPHHKRNQQDTKARKDFALCHGKENKQVESYPKVKMFQEAKMYYFHLIYKKKIRGKKN